jgi:hypothetical protein
MDTPVRDYITRCYPAILTFRIPHTIDPARIRPPLPEADRRIDVVFLGRDSTRRSTIEHRFQEMGFRPTMIKSKLWGTDRDAVWSKCRINLNLHIDPHTYFDVYRTLEAWA